MKINTKEFPFGLAFAAQTSARSFLRLTLMRMNTAPVLLPRHSDGYLLKQSDSGASKSSNSEPLSIYAVDDVPRLTELYTNLLEPAGYVVRTFNDRPKALAALQAERKKPSLLITDYLGLSMPINHFIHAARLLHPSLRILMASGFVQSEMRFFSVRPDRFIQKPFTPEEFQQEVRTALREQ